MSELIPVSLGIVIANFHPEGFSVWMQKRWEEGPFQGYWEFPGGKWEAGETPLKACRREVREEVGVDIKEWTLLQVYPVQRGPRPLSLNVHFTFCPPGLLMPTGDTQKYWPISFANPLGNRPQPFLAANEIIVLDLARYLREGGPPPWNPSPA